MPAANLLGTPGIFSGDERAAVPRGKTSALLYHLAYQSDWVSREDILYLFWPDTEEQKARRNLRQLLSSIRRLPFANDLETDEQNLRWLIPSDAQSFKEAVEQKQWAKAVELYHGPLLGDFRAHTLPEFESWLELERQELLRIFKDAALQLSQDFMTSERYREAAEVLAKGLEQDPFDEISLRSYLKAVFLSEGRDKAKQELLSYQKALARELGAEPEAATLKLFEELEGLAQDSELGSVVVSTKPLGDKPLHNLPFKLTPFVGRDKEKAELADYLANPACRLVTLLGPGGMGKTRLALAVAEEHIGSFEHGVWFVAFDALENFDNMLYQIVEALHFRFYGQEDSKDQLLNYLGNKDMLLVLDNLEHLSAGTPLITELLESSSKLKALTTSREVLNLQAEHVFEVGGLNLDQQDETSDAKRLFIQSAQKRKRALDLSEDNTPVINKICELVEGMPLAIELAASWLSVLTPQAIASELEQGLNILGGQTRDTPERHQSVRAVFNYSWNLLSERERDVLAKLAVFRGGFTRGAAKQVTGATLPILASLVNKSFLRVLPNGRYDRHPLVFEFCLEKLAERDDVQSVHERHAEYFLELAREAELQIEGLEQIAWLARLEEEHGNLRAVLSWALKNEQVEWGLRLAASLEEFWKIRGYALEGREWCEKYLEQPGAKRTKVRAKALSTAGWLAWRQFDYDAQYNYFEEGLNISRELNDEELIPIILSGLGQAKIGEGDYASAYNLFEESLVISQNLGDQIQIAHSLYNLGKLAYTQGDYVTAQTLCERSLNIFREQGGYAVAHIPNVESLVMSQDSGNTQDIAWPLHRLGHIAHAQGDYVTAHNFYRKSLNMFSKLGLEVGIANALTNLAAIAHAQGDYVAARSCLTDSLNNMPEQMYQYEMACAIEGWAALHISEGLPEKSAHLWGFAETLREEINSLRPPFERERYEREVKKVREQLGDDCFESLWQEGKQLSLDEAINMALGSS